jgi:poly-gamma-glutamate synthesis protein (capsule biosynthesis protein)
MMIVGDVFWGRAIETAAVSSGRGPANLFRGLTAADKEGYDAWIGDMECPITDKNIPYRTQVDTLVFNCRPEYAAEAAKWFDVLTLANNHTDNNGGTWGLEQTKQNLEKVGIQYFGTYNMQDEQSICEIVSLKAKSQQKGDVQLPVAFCGYDYVGAVTPTESQLNQMSRYAAVMPVIAMSHMGVEYRATAEPAKVSLYRSLIDHGADAVVGGHPHVVQNSEVYKGRLINYSTGNFLFDQQILGRETTETLGVGIKITIDDQEALTIYQSVATNCKTYKYECLKSLEQQIKKLARNFTGTLSSFLRIKHLGYP